MSKWLKHSIGEGVVVTRQATALRDGELQSASYVRMLPGNTEQLYPDRDYEYLQLNYGSGYTVVGLHYMTFENGVERLVAVIDITEPSSVIADRGWVDEYDINDFQTYPSNGSLVPNKRTRLLWKPTDSSLINRGAEYFLGVSGVYADLAATDPNRKQGQQLIFYVDSGGQLARRDVGFAPTTLSVKAEQNLPQLTDTFLQLPNNANTGSSNLTNTLEPEWKTLVERDLYGSNAAYLAEFETAAQRRELEDLFFSVTHGGRNSKISFFVPIASVKLAVPGNGYVFAYWATEVDDEFAVESAPSEITSVVNADPANAAWEVVLDWFTFLQGYAEDANDLTGTAREYVWIKDDDGAESGVNLGNHLDLAVLKNLVDSGAFPEKQTITLPLSDAQREAIQNVVTVDGLFANERADLVRLYRQNLGFFTDYIVEYSVLNEGSPSPPEPQGEGMRNAEDLREGRIARQGGLLTEFDRDELPIDYEDFLRDSGVTDPSFKYPTVPYVTRGGLGIFEYLRRPDNWAVGANMGQALLRVPWDPDLDSNQIVVSPTENPEQQPLIFSIPVVTEQQDTVKAVEPLRDHAIVITQGACFRLNYIPFEGSNQADRVLAQISGNHGTRSQRRSLSLATPRGQIVVFVSETSLMGTNGRGLFDTCPDFSIAEAKRQGYTFSHVELVDNPNEHRIEMWADGVRWDFLYHESQLKDIRGDGYGLVFKLMGPTRWYSASAEVRGVCRAHRPNGDVVLYHIVKDDEGGHRLANSSDNLISSQKCAVTTGKELGSSPKSRVRTKMLGVQHNDDAKNMSYTLEAAALGEGGGTSETRPLVPSPSPGFSEAVLKDGLGSARTISLFWADGAIGPLWTQVEESRGATGR